MGRHKKNEVRTESFTPWIVSHRKMPAWKALSFPAREAYFHLACRCFADTAERTGKARNNNGEIYRALRGLAGDMGCAVKTAGAALADLQAKGWIVCTEAWEKGLDGRGKTAKFRLTMMPMPNKLPTRDPERWAPNHEYPVTVYASYLPKPRKGRVSNLKQAEKAPPHSDTVVRPTRAQSHVLQ